MLPERGSAGPSAQAQIIGTDHEPPDDPTDWGATPNALKKHT
jgi:hypothetical protein